MNRIPALLAMFAALTVFALPGAVADDGGPGETCVEPVDDQTVCVTTTICYGLEMCIDLTDHKGTLKGVQQWLEEQTGPCACDPEPTPI